ncbi:MAG: RluA family pseudouridine synthase [Deltaproteobacteria bacterium]|nr:RluA family pseudouridine synthase [Deltaproteobacteria bacterium]
MNGRNKRMTLSWTVVDGSSPRACEFVARETGLPKGRVKDAMSKGALWVRRKGSPGRRLRRATTVLKKGDIVEFYYDEALLAREPPRGLCLEDFENYSLWYKPSGLMAQGTKFGDHCSLLRQAELFFGGERGVFPVHRLDRETAGLVLTAHTRAAAAKLSRLFREGLVIKRYRAEVSGNLANWKRSGAMEGPVQGREARTEFTFREYRIETDSSLVDITLGTGRTHQIRRHFAAAGFPLVGDPRYGRGNKNREGMMLCARELVFECPFGGGRRSFCVDRYPDICGSL